MKGIIIALVISLSAIGGAFYLTRSTDDSVPDSGRRDTPQARIENGTQVIDIRAKGGYAPRKTEAKAGTPSVLRVSTNGSFDCSIALVIPSLGYRKNLSPTGSVDIPVPPQEPGAKLQGLCAMGMYGFEISFN